MPNPDHIDGYFDMSVPGSCSTQLNGAFVVHANGSTQLTYKGAASGGSVTLNFVAVNPLMLHFGIIAPLIRRTPIVPSSSKV